MEKVCVYDEKFRFGDVNNFSFSFDIAKHLSRVGYNVTLVCVADEYLITNDKVKVVPLRVLDNVLCEENFEVLLCNGNITNTLNIKCDSKYLINNFSSETMSLFDGFFYVTENQKNKLLGNGFLNIKKIEVFVNKELYDISYDIPKKNKMVWTSCDFNALFFFLKSVFPLIKKEIDDFEMEIVNLDGLDDNLLVDYKDVRLYKNLGKKETALKQLESKVWVYPNIVDNNMIDNEIYFQIFENLYSNNVIVTTGLNGLNDFLSGYVFVEMNADLSKVSENMANNVIEVLKNDTLRNNIINSYNKQFKIKECDETLENIIFLLKKGYNRGLYTDNMLRNTTQRLVFHFWVPRIKPKFYYDINNIHLECLKRYSDRFNESVFVLACDDTEDEYIKFLKKWVLECDFKGSIHIKIIKNDDIYREAITFNDEIMHKLDKLDGVTFFAHNKGTSRYDSLYNEFVTKWYDGLLNWIIGSYFLCLEDIKEVKNVLNSMNSLTYGSFLMYNSNENYDFYGIKWLYNGSFQWIHTKKLYDYIGRNKKGYNSGDAEYFIPNNVKFSHGVINSYRTKYTLIDFTLMGNNFFKDVSVIENELKFLLSGDDYDKYMSFYNDITNSN